MPIDVDAEQAALVAQTESAASNTTLQYAQTVTINSDQEYRTAGELLLALKERIKHLDAKRKSFVQPLNKVVRELNALFKPPLDAYKGAEATLKRAMGAYTLKAEQERQRALAEAAQVAQTQNTQSFMQLMQTANAYAAPEAKGTHTRDVWRFQVTDENALPREFLRPDEGKIGEHVRRLGDAANIPGVRVWKETTIVARGSGG